jgi:tetratricopeptide (TPR) repeat protein
MLALLASLVTAACAEPQEHRDVDSDRDASASKRLELLIRQLGAEAASARDDAVRELRRMAESAVPSLRKALEQTSDPEVKARLETVLRLIAKDKGQALYEKGQLKDALSQFAEAEGARDIPAYVSTKIARIKTDILDGLSDRSGASQSVAADVILKKDYGPWLMPVLLESLGLPLSERKIPSDIVLTKLGNEAGPHLCEALGSKNKTLAYGALSVLHRRGSDPYPRLPTTLRSLLNEPDLPDQVRQMARELYQHLTGVLIEDKQ